MDPQRVSTIFSCTDRRVNASIHRALHHFHESQNRLTVFICPIGPHPSFYISRCRSIPATADDKPQEARRIPNRPYKPSHFSSLSSQSMASIYRCANCGTDLNLSPAHLYPPNTYFEAGNKGTLSFSWVDDSRLRFTKEDKIRPFFETVNYWGIQRKRTKMQCDACGFLVGYIYDDGLPMMQGIGQFGMGPSQVIPRSPRYRFKTKALAISS